MLRHLAPSLLIGAGLLLAVPAALAQPASPDDDPNAAARVLMADLERIVTPNGVQEAFEVTLGGARQAVSVRGADRDNPILLYIHGGPGAVAMPMAWTHQRAWEDFFTVVQWDQRGAGKSYRLEDPAAIAPTMTPERYRDDAIELIDLLRARYGKDKVVVLGHSWGTVVGLSVAAARPDLLHAYIGLGQIINSRENERAGMAWTLERAREASDAEAVAAIEALRPYPDGDRFTIEQADGWRRFSQRYGGLAAYRENANFYLRAPRLSPEYDAADRKAWADGSLLSVTTLWPRLRDVSFADLDRLDVPVLMFMGRHDYTTPSPLAARWLEAVDAPHKRAVWFEHSAHLASAEEPGRFLAALLQEVLPLTRGDADARAGRPEASPQH